MAWTSYSGRHRITTVREGASCLGVQLTKPNSRYPNPIGKVCQTANGKWDYSYVGGAHYTRYGAFPTARAAVKAVVRSYRTHIGEDSLRGARKRRRR